MTENEIFDQVYSLYSGDVDYWDSASDEYALLRQYATAGINRWRYYEKTDWKELFTKLSDDPNNEQTILASTFTYAAPSDFVKNTGYVKIGGLLYTPKTPARASVLVGQGDSSRFVWFTGNPKDGYTLNINPLAQISAGDAIDYPYYRTPTYFTAVDDVTEMSDPMFLVYFILSRLYKNDGEGFADEFNKAEAMLEQMRTENMGGIGEVADDVSWTPENEEGFGY